MTSLPSTSLGRVLAAAKKLPAQTGATEQGSARYAGQALAILADTSGSMRSDCGPRRRIDILREALDQVAPAQARLIAFSNLPALVDRGLLPEPGGGTALHLAIREGARLGARRLLVISDGEPDSEAEALREADAFGKPIDVIYCGDDDSAAARDFMARLARHTGGRYAPTVFSAGAPVLSAVIRGLLPAP